MEKNSPQLEYVRVYFDRGSSQCTVDQGVGTIPFRVTRVFIHGYCYTEYANKQDDTIRPRFWLGMRDVVLNLNTETGVLHIESKVQQWQSIDTSAQTRNVESYSSTVHHQGN